MPPAMVHHQMVPHNGSPMHLTPPYCPVDQYPKVRNFANVIKNDINYLDAEWYALPKP